MDKNSVAANFEINPLDGKNYKTKAALRVGWKAESSPFDKDFESTFLKRIRAYDNEGVEFDIEMNFKLLEKTKYISDGDKNTIVTSNSNKEKLNNVYSKKTIFY